MPCLPWKDEQLDPAPEHPITPTKASGNDGAMQILLTKSRKLNQNGMKSYVQKRSGHHVLKYEVTKCWVTGKRAEMDEEVIQSELDAARRELMELSRQRKLFDHKALPTNEGF